MIEARALTKRFGRTLAVDDLSFSVRPGRVTGFLGPNGSGKSTTMRLLLGLDRADGGTSTFGGQRYVDLRQPLREVGALLDAGYAHPTRRARDHLRAIAASNAIVASRVEETLELVGLASVARQRVGSYSLGMRQRLGLAAALLGDPHTLVLDEPANGLDPEGIQWIRRLLQAFARQDRTVLVSSHLLSEMALMAEELVVIGRGRLITQASVDDFVRHAARTWVRVRSPQADALVELLGREGAQVSREDDGALAVSGAEAAAIGELAAHHRMVLHELAPQTASLEEAFLAVTGSAVEFSARAPGTDGPAPGPVTATSCWPAPPPGSRADP